jgi:hypothetical protein
MKKNIFYTLCLLFLVGSMYSQQTVWVKATASGLADGSSEANAYGSFTTAFAQINSATDILRVVGNVPASGQSLNKNFAYTIEGDAGGSTLTGTAGAVRMFTNNTINTASQNVTFKNIKFTGATGSIGGTGGEGGGVLYSNQANTINFENCRFEGNSLVSTVTTGGGALFISSTTVTITDCLFKENTALSNGGAIGLGNSAGTNLTLTRCTFYKNKTTSTTGNLNAAALWVAAGVVNAYNCTFFQNTTGSTNQDYGVIRTNSGTTKVYNSLFYDNKLNTNVAAAGDWGSVASINSTLTNSLAQRINANVINTSSIVSPTIALASSGLTYDDVSGKVKYGLPTPGDASPIDYGTDGNDVGAWDSGLTLLNTWTGATSTDWTVASNWNAAGVPNATKGAVIETGTYQPIIGANASVKSLTLNASSSLTVNSGYNLTVTGAVANNGGTMTIENNANLIQGGTTNTNTGNVIVKRNSSNIQLYDYTLWSSPVAGQKLKAFSPNTLDARFYTYNSATNQYNVVSDPATTDFAAATGYLIRAPNTLVAGATAAPYSGTFTGVPNNGTINVTGLTSSKFYAVGNPYPSTISANLFLSGNTTDGTLYFWRKTNNSANTSYATYTTAGGVANSGGGSSVTPDGTIQVGQGFIVKTGASSTALNFTNSMRTSSNTSPFLRTTEDRSRFWLNLTNTSGLFSQMLVAYMAEATSGIDNAIDGRYINDAPVALTSLIGSEEFTVQGRALPFSTSDSVPLGFKTDATGNYTIAIDHVDGLFNTGQAIYLKDNLLNTVTDLSAGSYSFASAVGTFNSRFEVVYQRVLGVNNPDFTSNNIIAFNDNGDIKINSGSTVMEQVRVYDLQGRLLVEKKQINATETRINTTAVNQVLLLEITATTGSKVIKKIIQ